MKRTREAAVALVQRIMDGDYADEAEAERLLETVAGALGCPPGRLIDLVFWPDGPEPAAAEAVGRALEYRPFAL
ncbi:e9imm peptide [Kitasatospora sp. NPDC002227]|uniref:e9imm peptide n=1 Tax=Kitasatospora sp. NPDC002227 TaxID=3154773 RepID=UPI003317B384